MVETGVMTDFPDNKGTGKIWMKTDELTKLVDDLVVYPTFDLLLTTVHYSIS